MGRTPGFYSRSCAGRGQVDILGRAVRNIFQRLDSVGEAARQNALQNGQRISTVPLIELVVDQFLKCLWRQGCQPIFSNNRLNMELDFLFIVVDRTGLAVVLAVFPHPEVQIIGNADFTGNKDRARPVILVHSLYSGSGRFALRTETAFADRSPLPVYASAFETIFPGGVAFPQS